MNRTLIALLVLILASAFPRTEASETSEYASVLDGLSDVAWTMTPNDVLRGLNPDLSLVWLGRIEALDVSESPEKKVTLEFLCRHLELVDPNARALAQQPFRVRDRSSGYFIISLVSQMPLEQARKLQADFSERTHFALVGGHPVSVRKSHGKEAVFLYSTKAHMSDKISIVLERG